MILYVLSLALGAAAFGQITPTRVGPHQMGETLREWLVITPELEAMDAVCHSRKRGLLSKSDKETCRRLENIRDGKQNVIVTSESDRRYTWHFDNGKLSAIRIETPDPSAPRQSINVREEIDMLVRAYGKPSSVKTVSYRNAYGLTRDCSEMYWTMADATEIAAIESIDHYDEPVLMVVLAAKGSVEREKTTQEPKP